MARVVNPVEAALRRLARDLGSLHRGWALVGGLAVGARAEPRTTRDVDVAAAVKDDADAEQLVHALQRRGYCVLAVVEHEASHRLATARLSSPEPGAGQVVVDLLFASSGIEHEVVDRGEKLKLVPRLVVPVARVGHLLALKVLARDDRHRPQDWDDLRALLQEASADDLTEARLALTLIQKRGYHRGKRLKQQFEALVREHRPAGRRRPR